MEKEHKRYPTLLTNMSKDTIDKAKNDNKGDAMTDKKKAVHRKSLTPENISTMIEKWDDKTIKEWSIEFSVSYQTVLLMMKVIHKEDNSLCPPKPKKSKKRLDIAKAGIALFKKKQSKE